MPSKQRAQMNTINQEYVRSGFVKKLATKPFENTALKEIASKLPDISVKINVSSQGPQGIRRGTTTEDITRMSENIASVSKRKNVPEVEVLNEKYVASSPEGTVEIGGILEIRKEGGVPQSMGTEAIKPMPDIHGTLSIECDHEKREGVLMEFALQECHAENGHVPSSHSSSRLVILDQDNTSRNGPTVESDYASDIFCYLRSIEDKFTIQKNFLEGCQVTPHMRMTLVDWLAEAHLECGMFPETLHLSVWIVDKFLQENKYVTRRILQLVGVSAMLVASKYGQKNILSVEECVDLCVNMFSLNMILNMERKILKTLDFTLGRPVSIQFLKRYNEIAGVQKVHESLGKFILEVALLYNEMSHIKPSLQAAAACCLSIGILSERMDLETLWTPYMIYHTNYGYSQLEEVMVGFAKLLVAYGSSDFHIIRNKYGNISSHSLLNGPLVRKLSSMRTSQT